MTLAQLPVDILCEIFKFLPVEDIVRLTRVSRTLNEVIDGNRTVWLDAYRFTTLPRPLGPYSSQDTNDLKRILVRSAKVERNWPCLDLNSNDLHATAGGADRVYIPLSTRRLSFSSILIAEPVGDRWIVVVTKSEILCVDLGNSDDQDFQCTKLYECAANCELLQPSVCLTTTDREEDGVAYAIAQVFSQVGGEERKEEDEGDSIYIFKLHVHKYDEREPYMTAELKGSIPLSAGVISNAILVSNLLVIHTPQLPDRFWVVHTKTDRIYQMRFPERWPSGGASWPTLHLCSAHILITYDRFDVLLGTISSGCYIDAYPLPTFPATVDPNDTGRIAEVQLHLSHTGVCLYHLPSWPVLWECCNPRDQGGHTAQIILIGHRTLLPCNRGCCLSAVDLILHSSSEGVGVISYTPHDLFTPSNHLGHSSSSLCDPYALGPQIFMTMGGSQNRGVIDCSRLFSPPVFDHVFGFTISIEPQSNNGLCISFSVGRLQSPRSIFLRMTLGFCGNIGRIVRRHHVSEQAEAILEVIDFA